MKSRSRAREHARYIPRITDVQERAASRTIQKTPHLDNLITDHTKFLKKEGQCKMRKSMKFVLVLIAYFLVTSAVYANEIWSCEEYFDVVVTDHKVFYSEYLLAEDRFIPKKGQGAFRILENNDDHILAYLVFRDTEKPPMPISNYILIERKSGRFTEWDDSSVVMQNQYGNVDITSPIKGTCTRKQ